jgi:hypothetical protein
MPKTLLTIVALILSVIGFMIKLPSVFHHYDKELHTAFYFLAAGFLNILYGKNLTTHIFIFFVLLGFGIAIEYAQAYSNILLKKRIHGRFDIEDVKANAKGLIAFSVIWIPYLLIRKSPKA